MSASVFPTDQSVSIVGGKWSALIWVAVAQFVERVVQWLKCWHFNGPWAKYSTLSWSQWAWQHIAWQQLPLGVLVFVCIWVKERTCADLWCTLIELVSYSTVYLPILPSSVSTNQRAWHWRSLWSSLLYTGSRRTNLSGPVIWSPLKVHLKVHLGNYSHTRKKKTQNKVVCLDIGIHPSIHRCSGFVSSDGFWLHAGIHFTPPCLLRLSSFCYFLKTD